MRQTFLQWIIYLMTITDHNSADVENGATGDKIVIVNILDACSTYSRKCINCGGGRCFFYKKCPQFNSFLLWFQKKRIKPEDNERNTYVCTRVENWTKRNIYAEMASLYIKKTKNVFKDRSNEVHQLPLSRRLEDFQEHLLKVVNKRITDALNNFVEKNAIKLKFTH
ncbi:hypothetical protein GJ496_000089 [Pomphorhynchus laevis]|nr:hypothetical protein GJ496_000089 [Pomphorhynchus laevis]